MSTENVDQAPANGAARNTNPFQINLEQQKKRAKELMRAFKAGDQDALNRFAKNHPRFSRTSPEINQTLGTLSEAQLVIARELQLTSWPKLKAHITALDTAQNAIDSGVPADGDRPTIHIRCGSDLKNALELAIFSGSFFEYSNPFCQGPVTDNPHWLSERAEFIAKAYGADKARFYGDEFIRTKAEIQDRVQQEEERLQSCASDYDRVTLWFEHDTYDMLILMRLLAHFHQFGRPRTLELIQLNSFPGPDRFVGLGELPPAALRHIWKRRQPVSDALLLLGQTVWTALRRPEPHSLQQLSQSGTPDLPDCARAIERHLKELPDRSSGLALTEKLILKILVDEPRTAGRTFGALTREYEPLPFLGDLMFLDILLNMQKTDRPLFKIEYGSNPDHWPKWRLSITPVGKAVLSGDTDYLSLNPPTRWVGGVRITPGKPVWRWDADRCLPVKH
ncbi:MAG: DUF1835 domain-containing protein [Stappiaceae bacterium]